MTLNLVISYVENTAPSTPTHCLSRDVMETPGDLG